METAIVVPDNARWYVLHTYSGHEQKVAAAIKQRVEAMKIVGRVFDVIVPTRDTIVVKRGKKRSKNFPGYILIQMILDDDSWLVVRTTPALFFVGVGNLNSPSEVDPSPCQTFRPNLTHTKVKPLKSWTGRSRTLNG